MPIRNLRVVFLGVSHPYSRTPLRALDHQTNIVGIIESAPMGYKPPPPNTPVPKTVMQRYALRRKIPWFFLKSKGERPVAFLQSVRPDILCIAGLSQLIRKNEFEIAPLGAINFHPSLLPNFRGPRPFLWQAHQADLAGGVTIHQVDEGIDTGDILVQKSFPIRAGATHFQIRRRCLQLGSSAMLEALRLITSNQAKPRPQRHLPCPLYARHVNRGEAIIDWQTWPIQRVWHFLRGIQEETTWLRPPPEIKGWWAIGQIERTGSTEPPGAIAVDPQGHYVAHHEGKIRLNLSKPPNRIMRLAYRIDRRLAWW